MVDISFAVPCYNEEKNIQRALEGLVCALAGRPLTYEIIVIDDGSRDETSATAKAYQAAHPDLPIQVKRNTTRRGLGASYFEGAAVAQGEYYMVVHGDGDMPAESLSKVIDKMGQAEIVNPYVVNQGDRPFVRRVISFVFRKLVDLLGGHRLHYYTGPVLHRRANVLKAKTRTRGFGYQAELLCYLLRRGCSVVEVPFVSKYHHHQTDAFHFSNFLSVSKSLYRIFLTRFTRRRMGTPSLK